MNRTYLSLSVAVIGVALVASLVIYPQLPASVPIHWNIHGQADGYGPKAVAAILLPSIMSGVLLLLLVLPWLSPKQFEIDSFRTTYGFICLTVICLMAYMHGVTLWAAAGRGVDMLRAIVFGLLLMFALIGNVLGKVRRNFWVGVRTPWTLASERVWNDTHRLAGRLFVAAALLGFVVLLLPMQTMIVFFAALGLITLSAVFPAIYSLAHYKRLQRHGEI